MRRQVYLPLVAETAVLVALVAAIGVLGAVVVVGPHPELLLLIVPGTAGAIRWLDSYRRPKVAPRLRRALLADAIDRAPHRLERGAHPTHRLYGTFVEATAGEVVIALVCREPGSREVTIIERRRHRGDEVEAAAAAMAAVDARAADLERQVRERQEAEREAAEEERRRRQREADDARLREIDEQHVRDIARRETELRTEDDRARRREAELEAEALARALRR